MMDTMRLGKIDRFNSPDLQIGVNNRASLLGF